MAKRTRQRMIYKTPHRKLKIEQHETKLFRKSNDASCQIDKYKHATRYWGAKEIGCSCFENTKFLPRKRQYVNTMVLAGKR